MHPTLPIGPFALPTGPLFALFAIWFGLESASRLGRRLHLGADDVWNTGLAGLLTGLIVSRLWNVVQFRYIYLEDPLLVFSLRPSGFVLLPGVFAALIAISIWMVRKSLSPVRVAAAFSGGLIAASICLSVSSYLTGQTVGMPSRLLWAQPYYDALVHPVGIYRAVGLLVVLVLIWILLQPQQPLRTVLVAGFGYGIVHLISDAFLGVGGESVLIGRFQATQIGAWGLALLCALLLARLGDE